MMTDQDDKDIIEKDANKFGDVAKDDKKDNNDALFADNEAVKSKPSNEVTANDCLKEAQEDPDGIPQLDEEIVMDTIDESGEISGDDEPNEKEPDAKRQRLKWLAHRTPLTTTVGRTLADQEVPDDLVRERLACLNMASKVRDRADVRQLIRELEELPKFQLPNNRRGRKKLRADGKHDVAEIYSPPRMAEAAAALGLKSGWSLDLTTCDQDGEPWDFSSKTMRARARTKLRADKPYLLVCSPMCGPFSELQELFNYPGKLKKDVKEKLEAGLEHFKFCLELCIEQHRQGRSFMIEHPAGASTWTTNMIDKMKRLEGVELITFDFCTLGMEVMDKSGDKKPVRKRTSLLTNSQSIQLLLREAKCKQQHVHAHLLNGTAKECQIYPEKFCRIVCEAVKRDLDNILWRDELANVFDITQPFGKLMAVQEKAERLMNVEQTIERTVAATCPPEEDPFLHRSTTRWSSSMM